MCKSLQAHGRIWCAFTFRFMCEHLLCLLIWYLEECVLRMEYTGFSEITGSVPTATALPKCLRFLLSANEMSHYLPAITQRVSKSLALPHSKDRENMATTKTCTSGKSHHNSLGKPKQQSIILNMQWHATGESQWLYQQNKSKYHNKITYTSDSLIPSHTRCTTQKRNTHWHHERQIQVGGLGQTPQRKNTKRREAGERAPRG